MRVASQAYVLASGLPPAERYGMASQIQRAAVSVPSNIAEGWGRGRGAANLQFARVARGSLYELRTLLLIARDVELREVDALAPLLAEVEKCRRLLQAYISGMELNIVREPGAGYSNAGGFN